MNINTITKLYSRELFLIPGCKLYIENIISKVLKLPIEFIHTWPQYPINKKNHIKIKHIITNKNIKMLNHYIINSKIGKGPNIKTKKNTKTIVSKNVMTPRNETEELIFHSLNLLKKEKKSIKILELGTGSGIISIGIAKNHKKLQITALDKSKKALFIAKKNIQNNKNSINVKCISLLHSNWFEKINKDEKFDLIISNPPYISDYYNIISSKKIKNEPKLSLLSGKTGYESIFYIIDHSYKYLSNLGFLILEHGRYQSELIKEYMLIKKYTNVSTYKDLYQRSRIIICQK